MTPAIINFSMQASYDPVNRQVQLQLPQSMGCQEFFAAFSQQVNGQEPYIPQQPTFIRKPYLHFYSSALGIAGGVSLVISCIWSILLPAIGSIGIIGIAYLVKRKIVPLNANNVPPEANKSQMIFKEEAERVSLLDDPNPIITNNPTTLMTPLQPESEIVNKAPPPPPPPFPPSPPQGEAAPMGRVKPSTSRGSKGPDPRDGLLRSIREGKKLKFSIENAAKSLMDEPERYPLVLLLKELKSTYERALNIEDIEDSWKSYFINKVGTFGEKFKTSQELENQITKNLDMETICEKAKTLSSLLENMKWIKSLLNILSDRQDLSTEIRNHCSKKAKEADKHIEKLQSRNEKKLEKPETKEPNNNDVVTGTDTSQPAKSMEEAMKEAMKTRFSDIHGDEDSDDAQVEEETDLTDSEWN